jgi:aminoglycoside 2'-N-acetyltransferase I
VREVRLARTAELDDATLAAAHELLLGVFVGDDALTEADWRHCLGGLHALAYDDGELVGHGSLVSRELARDGVPLSTGYVEGVGVRADRRRRGHAAALMAELERVIATSYEIGALGATDEAIPFYAGRGWRLWPGETWATTPDGVVRTPEEDDCIFVFPGTTPLVLAGSLACDLRDGDGW